MTTPSEEEFDLQYPHTLIQQQLADGSVIGYFGIDDPYWKRRAARFIEVPVEKLDNYFAKHSTTYGGFLELWSRRGYCDYGSEFYVAPQVCLERLIRSPRYNTPAWEHPYWVGIKRQLISHFLGKVEDPRIGIRLALESLPELLPQIFKTESLLPHLAVLAGELGYSEVVDQIYQLGRPDLDFLVLLGSIRGNGKVLLPALERYLQTPEDPNLYPSIKVPETPGLDLTDRQNLVLQGLFRGRSPTLLLIRELVALNYGVPRRQRSPRFRIQVNVSAEEVQSRLSEGWEVIPYRYPVVLKSPELNPTQVSELSRRGWQVVDPTQPNLLRSPPLTRDEIQSLLERGWELVEPTTLPPVLMEISRLNIARSLLRRVYQTLNLPLELSRVDAQKILRAVDSSSILVGQIQPKIWPLWVNQGVPGSLALILQGAARVGDLERSQEILTQMTDLAREGIELGSKGEQEQTLREFLGRGGTISNYSLGYGLSGFPLTEGSQLGNPRLGLKRPKLDLDIYYYGLGLGLVQPLIWLGLVSPARIRQLTHRVIRETGPAERPNVEGEIQRQLAQLRTEFSTLDQASKEGDREALLSLIEYYLEMTDEFESSALYPILLGLKNSSQPVPEELRVLLPPEEAFQELHQLTDNGRVQSLQQKVKVFERRFEEEERQLFERLGAAPGYISLARSLGETIPLSELLSGSERLETVTSPLPLGTQLFQLAPAFIQWYTEGGLEKEMEKLYPQGAIAAGKDQEILQFIEDNPERLEEIILLTLNENRLDLFGSLVPLILSQPNLEDPHGLLGRVIKEIVSRGDYSATILLLKQASSEQRQIIRKLFEGGRYQEKVYLGALEKARIAPHHVTEFIWRFRRLLAADEITPQTIFQKLPEEPRFLEPQVDIRTLRRQAEPSLEGIERRLQRAQI